MIRLQFYFNYLSSQYSPSYQHYTNLSEIEFGSFEVGFCFLVKKNKAGFCF
jgi:hypothetical protein